MKIWTIEKEGGSQRFIIKCDSLKELQYFIETIFQRYTLEGKYDENIRTQNWENFTFRPKHEGD